MGKIASLDFFACAAAAGLLYGSSRIFAKEEQEENVPGTAAIIKPRASSLRNKSFAAGMAPSGGFAQAVAEKPPSDISHGILP